MQFDKLVRRNLRIVAFISVCILLVSTDYGQASEAPQGTEFQVFKNNPEAHDFTMMNSDGNPIKLSDLRGRVVILNFWRRDCHYCTMEKKYLKKMVQNLNRPDLTVVCVNFWDNPAEVIAYGKTNARELMIAGRANGNRSVIENVVKGRPMGYFILNDSGEAIYEVKGFPSSYVIDKEGRVVAGHVGMAQWADAPVRNWISSLAGTEGENNRSAPDGYELPGWMNRLLSRSPDNLELTGLLRNRHVQVHSRN